MNTLIKKNRATIIVFLMLLLVCFPLYKREQRINKVIIPRAHQYVKAAHYYSENNDTESAIIALNKSIQLYQKSLIPPKKFIKEAIALKTQLSNSNEQ